MGVDRVAQAEEDGLVDERVEPVPVDRGDQQVDRVGADVDRAEDRSGPAALSGREPRCRDPDASCDDGSRAWRRPAWRRASRRPASRRRRRGWSRASRRRASRRRPGFAARAWLRRASRRRRGVGLARPRLRRRPGRGRRAARAAGCGAVGVSRLRRRLRHLGDGAGGGAVRLADDLGERHPEDRDLELRRLEARRRLRLALEAGRQRLLEPRGPRAAARPPRRRPSSIASCPFPWP